MNLLPPHQLHTHMLSHTDTDIVLVQLSPSLKDTL